MRLSRTCTEARDVVHVSIVNDLPEEPLDPLQLLLPSRVARDILVSPTILTYFSARRVDFTTG